MTGAPSVELVAGGDAGQGELGALLERCPTSVAQQTPAWRDAIGVVGVDEAFTLGCRSAGRLVGVLPAYRFEGPLGAVLASSVQAGPLGGVATLPGENHDAIYAALLGGFLDLARERGCAVATVMTNPFWPDRDRYRAPSGPDYVLENVCQVLELADALGDDGALLRASSHHRRNLRRALEAPLRVDEVQSEESVRAWSALHRARHEAIGARPLPEALFLGALRHAVPRDKARFFFVRHAETGDLVAGGLYLLHGRVIDALMPSLDVRFQELRPMFLLHHHVMRWARARGIRFFNWQPSPPEGGVRRFKLQWGSRELSYAYLTWVTGDVDRILAAEPDDLRRAYPFHYVLPFDRLGGGRAGAPSSREDAWRAGRGP